MKVRTGPVFPSPDGHVKLLGISVRDLARIAALHGLLTGGTDLDADEAADYARRVADALFAADDDQPAQVINLTEELEAALRRAAPATRSWRFW